jgi:dihydroorotate dehydrogenase electron transfer subunit
MQVCNATVLEHEDFGGGYRRIIVEAPDVARSASPGQFLHIRVVALNDEALRRPFSIYQVTDTTVSVMYKPIGRGSAALASVGSGSQISIIGPLGKGFPQCEKSAFPVLVAGGYGVAPLSFFASRSPITGAVFIGAKAAVDVLCVSDFEALSWPVHVATEDGSQGHHGIITETLDRWLDAHDAGANDSRIAVDGSAYDLEFYCCGPDGLLRAVESRAATRQCKAWLSFDRPMGCGIGVCLACVQKIRKPNGDVTWARCCREGPVFDAKSIVWDDEAEDLQTRLIQA